MKKRELVLWIIFWIIVAIGFFVDTKVHAKETTLPTITVTAHSYKKIDKKVAAFAARMEELYQFDKEELKEKILSRDPIDTVLRLNSKHKAEKEKETPEEIAFRFERRVNNGVKFMIEHRAILEKAQAEYGIYPETLVGLIGVETNYGTYTGDFNVFDTLITLSFYGTHRDDYFRNELEHYLVTVRNLNWNIENIKGSYAGAIGIPQFMPSAVEPLWVHEKDKPIDIYNIDNAILSAANFLTQKGWAKNQPIATLTSRKNGKKTFVSRVLPGPYPTVWKKEANYFNMFHYNPSDDYVMSIFILSQKIKDRYADYVETLKHADELKLPKIEEPAKPQ